MKKCTVRKSVKPIVSNSMNSRAQVDLIDMQSQPDGKHRFILHGLMLIKFGLMLMYFSQWPSQIWAVLQNV